MLLCLHLYESTLENRVLGPFSLSIYSVFAVSHKQEKPVVNCVLELARIGWKYGIEPPNLIRMEREIEKESKEFEPPPFVPKPVEIVKEKPVEKPVEKKPEKVDLHKEVSGNLETLREP